MLVGSIGYIISLGSTAWAFFSYGDAMLILNARRPGLPGEARGRSR